MPMAKSPMSLSSDAVSRTSQVPHLAFNSGALVGKIKFQKDFTFVRVHAPLLLQIVIRANVSFLLASISEALNITLH